MIYVLRGLSTHPPPFPQHVHTMPLWPEHTQTDRRRKGSRQSWASNPPCQGSEGPRGAVIMHRNSLPKCINGHQRETGQMDGMAAEPLIPRLF